MSSQIKVLIGDDSAEFGVNYAYALRKFGMYVVTRPKNGEILLDEIKRSCPDVVIMDAVLPGIDAIDIIKEIKQSEDNKTSFIITSSYDNPFIEKQVMNSGAGYFMLKPLNLKTLSDRIFTLTKNTINSVYDTPNDIEGLITEILNQMGMPVHIKGFHYLREAIIISFEKPNLLGSVTKVLYPSIARKYNTTSPRVERAIRHAIDIVWTRGTPEVVNRYFGYNAFLISNKPTNSEIIALMSDKLRCNFNYNMKIKNI